MKNRKLVLGLGILFLSSPVLAQPEAAPGEIPAPVEKEAGDLQIKNVTPPAAASSNSLPPIPVPVAEKERPVLVSPVGGTKANSGAPAEMPGSLADLSDGEVSEESSDGVPRPVGAVLDRLKKSEQNVSVDDLSRAHDALTRLDLLLEIERKLAEINKVRDARLNGDAGGRLGGGMGRIPAGALNLPMGSDGEMKATPVSVSAPIVEPPVPKAAAYVVERISGTGGNIAAVLVTPSGSSETVREGDTLPGNIRVVSVNADGVMLDTPDGERNLMVQAFGQAIALNPGAAP